MCDTHASSRCKTTCGKPAPQLLRDLGPTVKCSKLLCAQPRTMKAPSSRPAIWLCNSARPLRWGRHPSQIKRRLHGSNSSFTQQQDPAQCSAPRLASWYASLKGGSTRGHSSTLSVFTPSGVTTGLYSRPPSSSACSCTHWQLIVPAADDRCAGCLQMMCLRGHMGHQ